MDIPQISRFEYGDSCGWLARYYASNSVLTRLFSDSRYGYDPAQSQVAACRWLAILAQTVPPRVRYRPGKGICLRWKRERKISVLVYDVNFVVSGRRKTTTFRVHHYVTQQAAREAAQAYRRQMEQRMQAERVAILRRQWSTK